MKKSVLVACFSNNSGGMELNSMGIARLLTPSCEVFLVCRRGSYIDSCREDLERRGVRVFVVDFHGNLSLRCIFSVRKILKDFQIKNLIFFGASELKSLALACLGLKIHILNFHGTTKTHNKKDFIHSLIYKAVSVHVAVSEHIRRNVMDIIPGAHNQNVKVIYLPYDSPARVHKSFSAPFCFVNISRITFGKGHLTCLNMMEKMLNKGVRASLTFVGKAEDVSLEKQLLEKCERSSVLKKHVFFKGFVGNVGAVLEEAQFMLFPSLGEGLSNSVIEAFFHKVLPITYNNTVFPEYLSLGFTFPQAEDQSEDDLFLKIESVLQMSAEQLQQAVDLNYQTAQKHFSAEKIRNDYLNLLV